MGLPDWISSEDELYGNRITNGRIQLTADAQLPGSASRNSRITFRLEDNSDSETVYLEQAAGIRGYSVLCQSQSRNYVGIATPSSTGRTQVVPILMRCTGIIPEIFLDGTSSGLIDGGMITVKYMTLVDSGNLGRSYPKASHPKWKTATQVGQTDYVLGPSGTSVDPTDTSAAFSGYLCLLVTVPPLVNTNFTIRVTTGEAGSPDNSTDTDFTLRGIEAAISKPEITMYSTIFPGFSLDRVPLDIDGHNVLVKFPDLNSRIGGNTELKFMSFGGYDSESTIDPNILYGGDILICPAYSGTDCELTIKGGKFIAKPTDAEIGILRMYQTILVEDLITGETDQIQIWIDL